MAEEIKDYVTYHESSGRLVGAINIRRYIEGGMGVVTLKSPTGEHHTYSFRTPVEDNFPDGTLFCYCRVRDPVWRYIGMYNGETFRRTQASRYSKQSPLFKGAKYIVKMMMKDFDTPMELYHEGVCSVCGRQLTAPKSIARGVGPVCYKRLKTGDNLT